MPFEIDNINSKDPWKNLNEKIMKGVYEPISISRYSLDIHHLVASMLTVDPKKRPSVNQIMKHPRIEEEIRSLMKQ